MVRLRARANEFGAAHGRERSLRSGSRARRHPLPRGGGNGPKHEINRTAKFERAQAISGNRRRRDCRWARRRPNSRLRPGGRGGPQKRPKTRNQSPGESPMKTAAWRKSRCRSCTARRTPARPRATATRSRPASTLPTSAICAAASGPSTGASKRPSPDAEDGIAERRRCAREGAKAASAGKAGPPASPTPSESDATPLAPIPS